ncbi:MAG: 4-carboxy-4-hydroxy-2-oxoadipate aldolase/oxaloacetate decarboxylase [Christensenellales bacterium]|jgi:4-hydroxy-4-methyl-2-oxoglutarate aldolase
MINIYKTRPIASDDCLKKIAKHSAATIHEAIGRIGAMKPEIKPLDRSMKCVGRALTVQTHAGDNIMLIKAISMAQPGDVLVINSSRTIYSGPFGEVLATECITRGIFGMVFDGSVRDSAEIIEMGFPVFSTGISILGTSKATLGTINHPISCGGVVVNPGDVILADCDGVVVIPYDMADEAAEKADARVAKEEKMKTLLKNGASQLELGGYQKILDALGCTEEK